MDEIAVNKMFNVGHDRTSDTIELIPETQEGEAEIVGIFIAAVNHLALRWGMTDLEAIKRVTKVIPKE